MKERNCFSKDIKMITFELKPPFKCLFLIRFHSLLLDFPSISRFAYICLMYIRLHIKKFSSINV